MTEISRVRKQVSPVYAGISPTAVTRRGSGGSKDIQSFAHGKVLGKKLKKRVLIELLLQRDEMHHAQLLELRQRLIELERNGPMDRGLFKAFKPYAPQGTTTGYSRRTKWLWMPDIVDKIHEKMPKPVQKATAILSVGIPFFVAVGIQVADRTGFGEKIIEHTLGNYGTSGTLLGAIILGAVAARKYVASMIFATFEYFHGHKEKEKILNEAAKLAKEARREAHQAKKETRILYHGHTPLGW